MLFSTFILAASAITYSAASPLPQGTGTGADSCKTDPLTTDTWKTLDIDTFLKDVCIKSIHPITIILILRSGQQPMLPKQQPTISKRSLLHLEPQTSFAALTNSVMLISPACLSLCQPGKQSIRTSSPDRHTNSSEGTLSSPSKTGTAT